MDQTTRVFWIIVLIDVVIWLCVARAQDNPYRMSNGWWTCPNGALVDPYGEICIPFIRGPQVQMSLLPSAGEGSTQPSTPNVTYIVPSAEPSVNSTTNNIYIVPDLGTRQGILDRAMIRRR